MANPTRALLAVKDELHGEHYEEVRLEEVATTPAGAVVYRINDTDWYPAQRIVIIHNKPDSNDEK